ncbi:hypothetical protein [Streptomyces sp. NBC_00467]|uniref:hypothetical protein n=1 Tax=Streptomyces sp. NBC_00467 TaxID=2975752 RepID=UPI002E19827F
MPSESIDPIRISIGEYLSGDGQVFAKPYTLLRRHSGAPAMWRWRSSRGKP